jgi:Flp pilus assembly protein TadG
MIGISTRTRFKKNWATILSLRGDISGAIAEGHRDVLPKVESIVTAKRATRSTFVWRLLLTETGSAAIELAIIIPMMVLMMLGTIELYLYVRAVSEVEHTAFTVADILGQSTQVIDDNTTSNAANLGTIWNDAVLLAAPLNIKSNGSVIVTAVCDGTTAPCGKVAATNSMVAGTPQMYWQRGAPWNNTKVLTTNESTSNLLPSTWPFRNGDSAIVVEVAYTYNPFPMTQSLWPHTPGITTIYKRVYVRTRSGSPLVLGSS